MKNRAPTILLEYYQKVWIDLHREMAEKGITLIHPHPVRASFWQLVLSGRYNPTAARGLLQRYIDAVEGRMLEIISKHSVAYYLHAYRRIAPSRGGDSEDPTTIGLVRLTLEACFQKYGMVTECMGAGMSDAFPLDEVLDGKIRGTQMEAVLRSAARPQFVLRHFCLSDLVELYQLEKLAYEIWRASAALRTIGKGAWLEVGGSPPDYLAERAGDLDELLRRYDQRAHLQGTSATGTVYRDDPGAWTQDGAVFVPYYNTGGLSTRHFRKLFKKAFGFQLAIDISTNFIWGPFDLVAYIRAHEPFAESFKRKNGVDLNSVLALLACLLHRVMFVWMREGSSRFLHYWQRGYDGPFTRKWLLEELNAFLPETIKLLGLEAPGLKVDIEEAVRFLELRTSSRTAIGMLPPGPHSIFIPFGVEKVFVDYAWIPRILHYLFHGIEMVDQNFKGELLEEIVRRGQSVLPRGACRALTDERRQIDASFAINETLIIVECRSTGRSLGVESGDPTAIKYRLGVVESALSDVDEKAHWLSQHPKGTNYDVSQYSQILPVAVTPFPEFMPTLSVYHWLTEKYPRVLTPNELRECLEGWKNGVPPGPLVVPIPNN